MQEQHYDKQLLLNVLKEYEKMFGNIYRVINNNTQYAESQEIIIAWLYQKQIIVFFIIHMYEKLNITENHM